jgi:hypothetical protein
MMHGQQTIKFKCLLKLVKGTILLLVRVLAVYTFIEINLFKQIPGKVRICRWEDNIKMGLEEAECSGMDWIELAQDRDRWRGLVNAVINLRGSIKCVEFLD